MVLKKIGLTGSNGLVGNHLIPMLLKSNFIITPTAKIKTKNFKKLNMLNKINEKKLDTIFGNVDCLIHMASILPGRKNINKNHLLKVNYINTKILIDWAFKRNIYFIFFSSLSIYKKKKIEYIRLKEKIEIYLSKKKNFNYLILRPSSIYGHKQKDQTLLLNKINEIKKNKIIRFSKPFTQKLNFIHAHDVCRALLFLIKKKKNGIFNITNEKNITINNLIQILIKIFKLKKNNVYIKNSSKINNEEKFYFLKNKLQKLGWRTKITLYNGIVNSYIKEKIIS